MGTGWEEEDATEGKVEERGKQQEQEALGKRAGGREGEGLGQVSGVL